MNEKLLKIINHYGVMPQLKYFQSEVFELNEAIIKYEEKKKQNVDCKICKKVEIYDMNFYKNHIAEEIADVMVMLEQFATYYGITDDEISDVMAYKINRQLERIENEQR